MHLELAVPGLLGEAAMPRLPSLELLAARGRGEDGTPGTLERWLMEGFAIEGEMLPAGALTVLAAGRDPGDAFWLRADPVHLEIRSDGVTLTPAARLEIAPREAAAFAAALNAHFGEEFEWLALREQCWCVRVAKPLAGASDAPAGAMGAEGESFAPGAGATPVQALATEAQMLLHAHPANQDRARRGLLSVNSVWLWGAGPLPGAARAAWRSVSCDDPAAAGLARLAGLRHAALPAGLARWREPAPRDGHHLCLIDALRSASERGRALESLEAQWFAPSLAELRADRIGMLTLRDPESGRRWETTRADLRRFWRRARPLGATP